MRLPGDDAARRGALALCAALVVVLAVWHGTRLSPRAGLIATVILTLPWLMLLPGLLARRRRSYQVGAILTAPYLAYGLMEVLANPGVRGFAGATVLLGFALFAAFVHCLRVGRLTAA